MSTPTSTGSRKSRRISRACDFCHHRGIRCRPSQETARICGNCIDFGQDCTYHRPEKRRGVKPKHARLESLPRNSAGSTAGNGRVSGPQRPPPKSEGEWNPPSNITQSIVVDLIDVYFEVVYPIFPLFHRPSFIRKVSRGEYLANRSLFASVMAACALASARVRDGAVYSNNWDVATLGEPASEVFYEASKNAIPRDLGAARGLDYLRAFPLLALTDIQYGQLHAMHHHLGLYHSLVAMDALHDEANWPENLGIVETEERRRLFWSIYTLEVYSSVVWNGIIGCREAQSAVRYPTETDDEAFSDRGFQDPETADASQGDQNSSLFTAGLVTWLRGWNFTTDLYRILEHAVDHFHRKRPRHHWTPTLIESIFGETATSEAAVLDYIKSMYHRLPTEFKKTMPTSHSQWRDRYSFQAANIEVTVQLVQIVLFTSKNATIEQKCQTADDFIQRLANVPVAYLRAISSPLLHHLAGIGSILGSVFEDRLSERDYLRVRAVLLSMIDTLARLEAGLYFPAGASERLRVNVARIDEYMQTCRRNRESETHASVTANGQPISSATMIQPTEITDVEHNLAQSPDDYLQFQLPPALLEDWRWAFDFTQFGSSDIT